MPPQGFNDVPYTPKGKPNFPRNRRQPRSLSNLKPGNHLKRRLLAVLDLRAAQAEVGCPSWAGASTSAAGLRDAPQSRHKTHSQFLPWGLLVSCLDGTAHSRGVLPKNHPRAPGRPPRLLTTMTKTSPLVSIQLKPPTRARLLLCRTIFHLQGAAMDRAAEAGAATNSPLGAPGGNSLH